MTRVTPLQWGHDLSIVEGPKTSVTRRYACALERESTTE